MKLSDEQRSFVESDERRAAFIGGRQSGKSTAIIHRAAHLYSKYNLNDSVVIVTPTVTMREELQKTLTDTVPQISSSGRISVINESKPYSKLINGAEHVLYDEFQLSDSGTMKNIFNSSTSIKTISVTLTPSTYTDFPSIPKPYKTFIAPTISNPAVDPKKLTVINQIESGFQLNEFSGHKIIDTSGQMECVMCGEYDTYEKENALDRLASYGLFQDCDCE